jgi:hypothetical protein
MTFDIMSSIVAGTGTLAVLMGALWLMAGRTSRKSPIKSERRRHEHHEG